YRLTGNICARIASMQAKVSDIRISNRVKLTRHNGKMLFRRRIDIHKNCVSLSEKIECFLTLLTFYPVSVSQFNRNPKVAGQLQHVFELIEFMFARRKGRRQLQQQDPQLFCTTKDFQGRRKSL